MGVILGPRDILVKYGNDFEDISVKYVCFFLKNLLYSVDNLHIAYHMCSIFLPCDYTLCFSCIFSVEGKEVDITCVMDSKY